MTFTFRPAKREKTPLIVGLAGPTKSGKTFSAHRLARGLAGDGQIAMINAEGEKGHQYADRFDYVACEITRPYRPEVYTAALRAALELKPTVVIIDSMSHMHDGPGGLLEYHSEELDRLAGNDRGKRDRMNWTAWIKPKAAENEFIYTMLEADCHLVLCFRAKEKLKIVKGADPIDLGYQPIAGDRITFETLFTLLLPPHSKGVPDLGLSEMREPFDSMIPAGKPLDEATGRALAQWAAGAALTPPSPTAPQPAPEPAPEISDDEQLELGRLEEKLLAMGRDRDREPEFRKLILATRSESVPARREWLTKQIARVEAAAAAPTAAEVPA